MSFLLIDSQNAEHIELSEAGINHKAVSPMPKQAFLIDSSCHILHVDMPVKQVRQIKKALPFALEEQLACEIEESHLHYLGKEQGKAAAIAIQHTIMERIKLDYPDLNQLHFLPLMLPFKDETIGLLLMKGHALIRFSEFKATSIPLNLLAFALGKYLDEESTKQHIQLFQDDGDYSLLISQLESLGFEIKSGTSAELTLHINNQLINKKPENILSGAYHVAVKQKASKSNKFKLPLALAASLFAFSLGLNWLQASQYQSLADATKQASKQFYQTLFPDERIRGIRRQFRDKLEDTDNAGQGGSAQFTGLLAQAGSIIKQDSALSMENVRYTAKKSQLELEILANSIGQLDKLKSKLESNNLKVEIASANNVANKKVKGMLKVSHNG